MTATKIVHWPGQSVPACDTHAQKLQNLAAVLGFSVTATPAYGQVCTNCVNEKEPADGEV